MKSDIKHKIEQRTKLENLVDVTFYIPCYNEEFNITLTLDKLITTVKKMRISFEVLIFNDGSTDKTKQIINTYIRAHPKELIRVVHNKKNMGLGYNYNHGAFIGLGKYYMMICGDNSETPESIVSVLEKMGKADIIIPYFGNLDTRKYFRRQLSRVFCSIVNLCNGYHIKYYNGIVLHKRENIIKWHPICSGFAYQAELLSILLDQHKTYIEVNISNIERKSGMSKAFHAQNFLSVGHSLSQILLRRIKRRLYPAL
jgi:glycosyltransferase involved in cell wall biosynthesis